MRTVVERLLSRASLDEHTARVGINEILLRHRDQLELLRDDPTLDATFADELLRYDSPVQMSRRITLAPYEIDGRTFSPGTVLMTALGAANRDPAKWGPTAEIGRAHV